MLTSYSANNLRGWPRFSNPPLLSQEVEEDEEGFELGGGKKTKINLFPYPSPIWMILYLFLAEKETSKAQG